MTDTTKTAEERARETAKLASEICSKHDTTGKRGIGDGGLRAAVTEALNQEHQRGYERGLDDAAEVAGEYPSLWEEPECAAAAIRKLSSSEIKHQILSLKPTT